MKINENVNYTPDNPSTCKPTSEIVCRYCMNTNKCPNKMPFEPYNTAPEVSEKEPTPVTGTSLFDE